MNNLCCVLDDYVHCYYCKAKWCSGCWSAAFSTIKRGDFAACLEGKWSDIQGGHYTMTYHDQLPSHKDVEAKRFKSRGTASAGV